MSLSAPVPHDHRVAWPKAAHQVKLDRTFIRQQDLAQNDTATANVVTEYDLRQLAALQSGIHALAAYRDHVWLALSCVRLICSRQYVVQPKAAASSCRNALQTVEQALCASSTFCEMLPASVCL
jgi:hypothetical protein